MGLIFSQRLPWVSPPRASRGDTQVLGGGVTAFLLPVLGFHRRLFKAISCESFASPLLRVAFSTLFCYECVSSFAFCLHRLFFSFASLRRYRLVL